MLNPLAIYRGAFSNIQRNVWILSVAMFINRSGSMVLLFTSLYLTRDQHFTIQQAGFALSFYGIGSVLGSYFGGWLSDRGNMFNVMTLSLLISGMILLLLPLVHTAPLISLIIFAYAFTADIFRPANSKAIALFSKAENRTRSVSLVRLAVNLGFSVGPAIGGFIALYLGYKWLFVIDSCTSFLAAIMVFFMLPRTIEGGTSREAAAQARINSRSAYHDPLYLIFILLVAFFGIAFFQLFASIPQFYDKVCHYKEDTIGLLLGLNGLLVVIIEMPLIAALEKKQRIFRFIISGILCIPVAFLLLQFGKGLIIFSVLYTVVITLSEILAMPFMMNFSISRPVHERQGQYSALYSISYGLANIFAPILGLGIAGKYGFDAMFDFFVLVSILTAGGFFFLKRKLEAELPGDK